MYSIPVQKRELLVSILLSVMLFMGVFGLYLSVNMSSNGMMQDCIMATHDTPQGGVCPMNLSEHVRIWNQTFTSNPDFVRSLLICAAVLMAVGFIRLFLEIQERARFLFRHILREYRNKLPDIPMFDYLTLILSRGRLRSIQYA